MGASDEAASSVRPARAAGALESEGLEGLNAAVLAGGRSARFGSDKSRARFEGETLLERVRAVLSAVVDRVVTIGGAASEVAEPEPGAGPLQAVIAALREARARGAGGALVVACDLPLLDVATVRQLAAPLAAGVVGRVPRVDGRLQVLAAHWSVGVLEALEQAWDAGERSLTRLCATLALDVRDDWDARALSDVDTPEALARLVERGPTAEVTVWRWPVGEAASPGFAILAKASSDRVAREEPLEIVVDGAPLAVLLRTPAGVDDDLSLAAGFLLAEGVIDRMADLDGLGPCLDPAAEHRENRVLVTLAPGVRVPDAARRSFATGASCGLCGKTTLASIVQRLPERAAATAPRLADVQAMGAAVRAVQAGFAATGAVHAAALFEGATLMSMAEDVGRHNAVDKVFGRALRRGELPLRGKVLWVSGRVSFELVQKALVAGVDGLVAVGAPTSLAIELAERGGLHLAGFVRDGRANVYAGALDGGRG